MANQDIATIALKYMEDNDPNFYASDNNVTLKIFGGDVDVESLWYSKDEQKVYLHVGCEEFEGDIDIESLSDYNQWILRGALKNRWKKFNPTNEPMELEFFSIEPDGKGGKEIHILGYIYGGAGDEGCGDWRLVEYSFFIEPLEEFISHYNEIDNYVDNTASEEKQYISDQTDDGVVETINNYFHGNPADFLLDYCNVTMDTPCGNYCFKA